jgi:hypothetical protein
MTRRNTLLARFCDANESDGETALLSLVAPRKQQAHRIIQQVLADNAAVTDEKELRKLISAAYPWGQREYHPYQAWCKAVQETFAQPVAHNLPPKRASAKDYADSPLFQEVSE